MAAVPMNDWSEADLAGTELCQKHGERLKFCQECDTAGQGVSGHLIDCGPATASVGPSRGVLRESAIEAECTKLLEQDGWRALRTDPVSDRGRGKGFGELGMADHLYIRYWQRSEKHPAREWRINAEVLWIEFKRPGEKPKKHQVEWHTKERARGAFTLIAGEDFPATVEGFKCWYVGSGLMRRTRWW